MENEKKLIKKGFVDAKKMSEMYPDTFNIPDDKTLKNLVEGVFVKVCYKKERFWVKIQKIYGNKITGVVENELLENYGFDFGDVISFEKKNIYDITYG